MNVKTTATVDGDNRVIAIEMSANQTLVDNYVDDAARKIYNDNWKDDDRFKTDDNGTLVVTPYDGLTAQQKLSVIGLEVARFLRQRAVIQHVESAKETAIETAKEEIQTRYPDA